MSRSKVSLLAVGILSVGFPVATFAADGTNSVTLQSVLDPTSLVTAAAAGGGAALLAAFGLGGGFRIAKKAYAWVFSKM